MRGTFRCGLGGWHCWCIPGLEMSSPARKKWKWSKSGEKWKWTLSESGKESGSRLWVSLQIATLLLHVPAWFFSHLFHGHADWNCHALRPAGQQGAPDQAGVQGRWCRGRTIHRTSGSPPGGWGWEAQSGLLEASSSLPGKPRFWTTAIISQS